LIRETFAALKRMPINFIGNLDGKEVYKGKADIVRLATASSATSRSRSARASPEMISELLRAELTRTWRFRLGALLLKPAFANFRRPSTTASTACAPLLGVNGICIIGHGGSTAKAIKNAIRVPRSSPHSAGSTSASSRTSRRAPTTADFEERTIPF